MVRETALGTAASLLAARLNADHSDGEEPRLPCACGADARRSGRRSKTFTTALGPLTLERAWYHCDACGSGFSPRDRALRVEGRSLSPGALRMVGITAAELSFGRSSTLLRELAGLAVGTPWPPSSPQPEPNASCAGHPESCQPPRQHRNRWPARHQRHCCISCACGCCGNGRFLTDTVDPLPLPQETAECVDSITWSMAP